MPKYEGRLELTWTNKDQCLLADAEGSYEWRPLSDYRVAEVRLLEDVGVVGDVPTDRANRNLLIRGDALHALTSLGKLPEFRKAYGAQVRLAYLDPPFNTGQAFEHYDDALEHSVWLTMMRDRLHQLKPLMRRDGSVWVHCDDSEQAYLKVMMDEVFGRDCFVASIIWQKADTPRMDARKFSSSHDYLLCYSLDAAWTPRQLTFTPDLAGYPYSATDGRRYSSLTLRKWGHNSRRQDRPNLWYPIEHDGVDHYPVKPDGSEGYWRWEPERYKENKDRIEWLDKGNGLQPYVISFAPAASTRPYETLWLNTEVGHNREAKSHLKTMFPQEPFATPKPERLLARVIDISTDPGDIVLDCFLGSGTTAAVAAKMDRRWVGIERNPATVANVAKQRLIRVVEGSDPGGVSGTYQWSGGGGFQELRVSESMFEEAGGLVFLADGLANGALAEATAAQLGFQYSPEPPFAGRKGRARLAVIDGVVNEGVARLLTGALDENERIVICGTGIDPNTRPLLRELAPGSTLRKIPSALLERYRYEQGVLVPAPPATTAVAGEES